jgi:hypothetical protein
VLLLMPAAVLIVLVLASIAVDFGIAFLGEREVASLASHAANDAVTAALDEPHLRATGEYRLDPDRVHDVVRATIAAASTEVELDEPIVDVLVVDGLPAVRVELTGRVDYVFAPALPGGPDGADVGASAVAVAEPGG